MILRISNQPIKHTSICIKQEKPLEKWSNRDFLIYFSNRYKKLTGKSFLIPREAWIGMMSRIKGYREKQKLDNIQYKNFIDNVFNKFFVKDKYIPNFGAIVSEKIFFIVSKIKKESHFSDNEFTKLRDELYNNLELFKKLI